MFHNFPVPYFPELKFSEIRIFICNHKSFRSQNFSGPQILFNEVVPVGVTLFSNVTTRTPTNFTLTLSPTGSQRSWLLQVGGSFSPTLKFNEGGNWDPMLLFRSWTSIKIELTHKNLDPNLTNWARFWNFKKKSVKLEKNRFWAKMLAIQSILNIFWSSFLQTTQYW